MATQLQIRRGTSTQVAAFTGAEGEIVVNTTNDSVHVNDGSTQGGFELARVDGANWNVTNNISTTGSVTAKNMSLIQNSGFANLEMGGPSGAFIDLKSPSSDDFDGRIITTGSGMALDVASGSSLVIQAGGESRLEIDAGGEIAINEAGLDRDFRVESDGNTHMLFVDAGNNAAVFGSSTANDSSSVTLRQDGTAHVNNAQFSNGNGSAGGTTPSIYSPASATLAISTNSTERLRVDGSGRVSIGGTSSNQLLKVTSSTTPALEFTRGSGNATIGIDNGNSIAVGGTAGDLVLRASGTTGVTKFTDSGGNITMTLTEANNVGIGTSSPAFKLDLSGALRIQQSRATFVDASEDATASAHIFVSNDGVGDFSAEAGHLVIQARTHTSVYRDIIFAGGINNASDLMRITGEGFVGIGTTSPSRLLHLKADDSCLLQLQVGNTTGNCQVLFGDSGTTTAGKILYNHTGNVMSFETNSSEAMRIDGSGRLLHGVTSGNAFFHEENPSNQTGHQITTINGYTKPHIQVASVSAASTSFFHFVGQTGNGSSVTSNAIIIYGNGNIQNVNNSYGALSDVKLKENIVDSGSQWEDIKAVRVRKYSMIADKESAPNRIGVIAQELESAGMGGLVLDIADRDEDFEELETSTKSVHYSVLYMKAIKALQEAMTRIETLEAKVQTLESN